MRLKTVLKKLRKRRESTRSLKSPSPQSPSPQSPMSKSKLKSLKVSILTWAQRCSRSKSAKKQSSLMNAITKVSVDTCTMTRMERNTCKNIWRINLLTLLGTTLRMTGRSPTILDLTYVKSTNAMTSLAHLIISIETASSPTTMKNANFTSTSITKIDKISFYNLIIIFTICYKNKC